MNSSMPKHMQQRCAALQASLAADGISASIQECHDLLVAEALQRIIAKKVDTVSV